MSMHSASRRNLPSVSIAGVALVIATQATAFESSVQPALVYQTGNGYFSYSGVDHPAAELAHYRLILGVHRFFAASTAFSNPNWTSWNAIHDYNPATKIAIYQLGPATRQSQDSIHTRWLSTIARWSDGRGHSLGALGDDPSTYMLQYTVGGSTDLVDADGTQAYWGLFGSSAFQNYWGEATVNDMYRKLHAWADDRDDVAEDHVREWFADGLFVDVASALPPDYHNNSYTDATSWQAAMRSFTTASVAYIRACDPTQLMYYNVGFTRNAEGPAYWATLDNLPAASRPDGLLEENAFATSWINGTGIQFYPQPDWKRQVDTLGAMQNVDAIVETTIPVAVGANATDNYNRTVNFWDVVWYSLSSYLLGKNEVANNSYFTFWRNLDFSYLDEYDLDLGKAKGPYTTRTVSTGTSPSTISIYEREYEKGWVLVNPYGIDALSFPLPELGKTLGHDNFLSPVSVANTDTLALPANRGVVVLKDPVIGDWRFDETSGTRAGDSHEYLPGYSMDGTIHNAASPAWLSGGKVDGALQFDGVDDYVAVAHDTDRLVTPTELSISLWVKPASGSTGTGHATALQFGRWHQSGWQLLAGTGYNEFRFHMYGGVATEQYLFKPGQTGLSSSAWTHLAVTVENKAGGKIKMYMNGAPFHSGTLSAPFNSSASDTLYFGAQDIGLATAGYWGGRMDHVKIQRKVMSAYEVAAEYRAQVGDWRLDEPPYRRRAFDSHGSAHARVHGNATWLGSSDSAGTPRGAIQLDGVDDEIIIEDNQQQLATPTQFTVNAWVQPAVDSDQPVLMQFVTPANDGWALIAGKGNDEIGLLLYDGSGQDYFVASGPSPVALSTSAWNKVTVSVDNKNGGAVKLYVNDMPVQIESDSRHTNTLDRAFSLTGGELRLGTTSFDHWKGELGHVQLFGRVLGLAEIAQLSR